MSQFSCDIHRELYHTLEHVKFANKFRKSRKTLKNQVKSMEKLIDILEDNDDVQNVWHNWEQA